jgi:osmotically-inducible protein OsmY
MNETKRLLYPSLESPISNGAITSSGRTSLYDSRTDFITRIAPVGMAAIYFGSFSLATQDAPLSRQALFKLSFLNRHFLQPGGLKIAVNRTTAVLSGQPAQRSLVTMGEILAQQIEGIASVKDETQPPATTAPASDVAAHRESVQFLFATDQTLRSGVQVTAAADKLLLQGEVGSAAQKHWAEQLAEASGATVESRVKVSEAITFAATNHAEPPAVDDESMQALILFRLRLVRDTEHLPLKVKAARGVVTIQGKVRTEALRQRVENIARSSLGLRELRSTISIG